MKKMYISGSKDFIEETVNLCANEDFTKSYTHVRPSPDSNPPNSRIMLKEVGVKIKNAKIVKTFLGFDRDIFTFSIYLDYGGFSQRFGDYKIENSSIIKEILSCVGAKSWESLENTFIKVKCSFDEVYGICNVIGNDWLMFDEFFKNKGDLNEN